VQCNERIDVLKMLLALNADFYQIPEPAPRHQNCIPDALANGPIDVLQVFPPVAFIHGFRLQGRLIRQPGR